jgi:phage repressor protein C with HTH and peptisase S24 domain
MDTIRQLISDRIKVMGTNLKEVSLAIPRTHSYLQQYMTRGVPKVLNEHDRIRVAHILDLDVNLLRPGFSNVVSVGQATESKTNKATPRSYSRRNALDLPPGARAIPVSARDLPVYGTVELGGSGGTLTVSAHAVGWESRPEFLVSVVDAYGIIVTGDKMSPAHKNGSTAIVNPHIPARPGAICVFRSQRDGSPDLVQICELRRSTDEIWFVREYEPKRDFTLKRADWQVCDVTVASYFPG